VRRILIAIVLFSTAFVISRPAASDLTRDERVSDAQTMIATFDSRYAPADWKKDFLDVSLSDLTANLMGEVYRQDMTDEDFYAAMERFSGSLRDTHNWFIIPSSYGARLPLSCDYVEGKVIISRVDGGQMTVDGFTFKRGDELVSIDGVAAKAAIDDLAQYDREGTEAPQNRFLAGSLTYRSQDVLPYIPTGSAVVEIRSRESGQVGKVTLQWQTFGNPMAKGPGKNAPAAKASVSVRTASSSSDGIDPELGTFSGLEHLRWSAINEAVASRDARFGDFMPFFPLWDSFEKISDNPLLIGTFKVDGRRIGFIRIPTWHPYNQGSWIDLLANVVPLLESETDALVIDETDNGGGSICLVNFITGFFTPNPIKELLFQIKANKDWLLEFEYYLDYCEGQKGANKADCAIIKNIVDELRRAIAAGDRLTAPFSICGDDGNIHPVVDSTGKRYVYTKPILVLINEFSISAADMFPAPLQDSGRAKLFGANTCGAGGSVRTTEKLGYSEFQVSQTESLAVRSKPTTAPDGTSTVYIENVGVAPDIPYEITIDDFLGGYQGYRNAVDDAVRTMVGR
jgi:hypothetical protein